MFKRFSRAGATSHISRRLYEALVVRARAPVFYAEFAVPDTLDGRFDLLTAHTFLILEALAHVGPEGSKLAAEIVDVIFAGFDEALRELGVSDFGIARRMKAMAGAFYGRLEAYRAARTEAELAEALARNLYRGSAPAGSEAATLAHYMLAAAESLRATPDDLLKGDPQFGPLPKP